MADIKVQLNRVDHTVIASFGGETVLTGENIKQLGEKLTDLVETESPGALVVDFTGLGMLSSEALGMLVDLHKKQHTRDAKLIVCGLNPAMHKVLRATRLDLVMTFASDASETLELAEPDPE